MFRQVAIGRIEMASWGRGALRAAADFLYPPACRLCNAEVPRETEAFAAMPLCATCRGTLREGQERACRRCGATIGPYLDPEQPCAYCLGESFAFDRVVRLGVYDGPLRAACLSAKRAGGETLAAALAEHLWEAETAAFEAAAIDVVVPVPRFWGQRLLRPHHVPETLARVWSRRLKVPWEPHILRKVRWTRPQARLKPSERRTNLRRAFAVAGTNPLSGATVLLADDVMTTGTTAHEAARLLKHSGARRVVVAVVARGLGRR
jgi:ComF family protein